MIIPENNHYLQKYNCIGECIEKKYSITIAIIALGIMIFF